MIASDSVEDVVLENCNARAVCFNCPNMRQLSLKFSKMISFTLQNCSSLRSLDLQCESVLTHSSGLALHRPKPALCCSF